MSSPLWMEGDKNDREQDLLDSFDPRKSPHCYPNGIDETTTPLNTSQQERRQRENSEFGINLDFLSGDIIDDEQGSTPEIDDFDPRLSPHAYPDGIDATLEQPKMDVGTTDDAAEGKDEDDWTPFRLNSVKNDFRPNNDKSNPSSFSQNNQKSLDLLDVFDPRKSPHSYPNGIPSPFSSSEKEEKQNNKVGILLIDHGSKREASNLHLEQLASLYQERYAKKNMNYIVRAAHMEIASPSIEDGIQTLVEMGADQIVCHPYFLSPGRHVTEDIPQLIETAAKSVLSNISQNRNVQISTTAHVGSNMDRMLDAIGSLVDETLEKKKKKKKKPRRNENRALGGMLGEIQRMMDEQL